MSEPQSQSGHSGDEKLNPRTSNAQPNHYTHCAILSSFGEHVLQTEVQFSTTAESIKILRLLLDFVPCLVFQKYKSTQQIYFHSQVKRQRGPSSVGPVRPSYLQISGPRYDFKSVVLTFLHF